MIQQIPDRRQPAKVPYALRGLRRPWETAFTLYQRWEAGEDPEDLAAELDVYEGSLRELLRRMRRMIRRGGTDEQFHDAA